MIASRYRRFLSVLGAGALLAAGSSLAGSITGTVTYRGQVPKLKPIKMVEDPGCVKKHDTPPPSEVLVLGPGNTVANVFVEVKHGVPDRDYPVPSEPVVINQSGCQFKPRVLGIRVGQPLKILNSDELLHNVHALAKINPPFNLAMPSNVTEVTREFTKVEGRFKVKCDIHPWMAAWISVMSHPFFDVTGTDGKFVIDGLPAGTYEIEIWHERLATESATVTILGEEAQTVDFTLSPPTKKGKRRGR